MNELLFFIHILVLLVLTFISLKIGEKGLSCWIILMSLVSNLFVLKQITLFSLTVTAADAYTICGLFSLNLLQEYYGKEKASNLVWINFFSLACFALLSFIHLSYTPAKVDLTQNSYLEILSLSPRLITASLISFFLSQKFDLAFFSYLRERHFKNSLSKSSFFSSLLSQSLDTIFFSFLALYGKVDSIITIIFFSLLIKFLTIFIMSPMMNFSKKIMGKTC